MTPKKTFHDCAITMEGTEADQNMAPRDGEK